MATSPNRISQHIEAVSMPTGHVMVQSVAIAELRPFIEHHIDKSLSDEDIIDGYPDVLLAIQRGLLNLTDPDAPVLTLKTPITKGESGAVDTAQLTFKTRMKASTKESLFKGVNIAQEQQKYMNIAKAYFAGLPAKAMLDSLGKFDEKVVDQMTALFM